MPEPSVLGNKFLYDIRRKGNVSKAACIMQYRRMYQSPGPSVTHMAVPTHGIWGTNQHQDNTGRIWCTPNHNTLTHFRYPIPSKRQHWQDSSRFVTAGMFVHQKGESEPFLRRKLLVCLLQLIAFHTRFLFFLTFTSSLFSAFEISSLPTRNTISRGHRV